MEGVLTYRFEPQGEGTKVTLDEHINPLGTMRILSAVIENLFQQTLKSRLEGIKSVLESKD
jgi:hypothetical protein